MIIAIWPHETIFLWNFFLWAKEQTFQWFVAVFNIILLHLERNKYSEAFSKNIFTRMKASGTQNQKLTDISHNITCVPQIFRNLELFWFPQIRLVAPHLDYITRSSVSNYYYNIHLTIAIISSFTWFSITKLWTTWSRLLLSSLIHQAV